MSIDKLRLEAHRSIAAHLTSNNSKVHCGTSDHKEKPRAMYYDGLWLIVDRSI